MLIHSLAFAAARIVAVGIVLGFAVVDIEVLPSCMHPYLAGSY